MADTEQSENNKPVFTPDSPGIKVSYANNTHIVVSQTDVCLYFGAKSLSVEQTTFDNKIFVNHTAFAQMIEYWGRRYILLKRIYGDTLKTLDDFPEDLVREAFDEMYSDINKDDTLQDDDAKIDNK